MASDQSLKVVSEMKKEYRYLGVSLKRFEVRWRKGWVTDDMMDVTDAAKNIIKLMNKLYRYTA